MNPLWRDLATIFGPIAGVLIGWFLNEFGQLAKLRREDRRILGLLIADLLDVYDSAARLRFIEKNLLSIKSPSFNYFEMFKATLDHIAELHIRYAETVNALAASNPVEAYELRSKVDNQNKLYHMRDEYFAKSSKDENDAELIDAYKDFDQLHELLLSGTLRRTVIKLARKHGWVTWIKVRRVLRGTEWAESNFATLGKALGESYKNNKSREKLSEAEPPPSESPDAQVNKQS